MQSSITPSCLYIVATPIGHLADCSPRAREVLSSVDFVCAEDTRVGRQLFSLLGLPQPARGWVSVHSHNEAELAAQVLVRLNQGESAALISDAGTPAIADPGARLVAEAHRQGLRVLPVPGPSALTALLSVSGLQPRAAGGVRFMGFLPARAKGRSDWLAGLAHSDDITVFFEAPHRMASTFDDILRVLGPERPMAMGRELTKQFESVMAGTSGEVLARWQAKQAQDAGAARGEFVLALGPSAEAEGPATADDWLASSPGLTGAAWVTLVAEAMPPAAGAKLLAKALGCEREAAYAALLRATK